MRSFLPMVLNQAATLVLGIASVKLITTFVPPATTGVYQLFVTLTQIGVLVTHSGLSNHGLRYWQREQAERGAYARFLWEMSWDHLRFLAPLLLVISCLLSIIRLEPVWTWIFPLLLLSNIALAIQLIATGALNAEARAWKVFFLTLTANTARTFLPVGLALAVSMSFAVLSLGFALHGLIIFGVVFGLFAWAIRSRRPEASQRSKWAEELKSYGRPFLWLGVGAWFMQNTDRWVVEGFYGKDHAGFFAVAANIGVMIPTMVATGLMQRVFPRIFQKADRAHKLQDWQEIAKDCDRATGIFIILTLGGLLALDAAAPYLIGWLISAKYIPALTMLIPAALATVTLQINQFYYLLLQGQHNSAGIVKVLMVVAGFRTIGSVVSAAISWPAFLNWQMVSMILGALIGRFMVRRMALR